MVSDVAFLFPTTILRHPIVLMPVKMQLARIIISELTENQIIYLQEVDAPYRSCLFFELFQLELEYNAKQGRAVDSTE